MFHFSHPSKVSPPQWVDTYFRRLLAEAALEQLEFSVAEKAFVRFEDYQAKVESSLVQAARYRKICKESHLGGLKK